MDDMKVTVKHRRRKFVKRPLWRRRPELVILVMVGAGLAAVLIVTAVSGLVEGLGDTLDGEKEPAVVYDGAEQACFYNHPFGEFGLTADFKCDFPCNTCHMDGEF